MDLEPATRPFTPRPDRRPRVPEPLPVRLVTVDDARVAAPAGLERQLDAFYVGVLGFAREPDERRIAYRADNFTLHVDVKEPPLRREDVRALGVEVPSLADLEPKLIEQQIEYTRQRGLLPGEESIVLMDPGGNWLTVVDRRAV